MDKFFWLKGWEGPGELQPGMLADDAAMLPAACVQCDVLRDVPEQVKPMMGQ